MNPARRIVVISGVSGAGKSSVARALEDEGFFVVDNLPVQMLEQAIELVCQTSTLASLAFVVDVRDANFIHEFPQIWTQLKKKNSCARLVFLDASDDIIVRRFKETRRRHTLENGTGLRNSIAREREIVGEIRSLADEVLNTDALTVHQLVDWTKTHLSQIAKHSLSVTLMSFGFKYGLPVELDMCFDVRFIENPYFVPELKLLHGLNQSVSQFVLSRPGAQEFLSRVTELIQYLIPLYQQEGKNYLTIGIGCTGGQHRSPAIAVAINELLSSTIVRVEHRNLN